MSLSHNVDSLTKTAPKLVNKAGEGHAASSLNLNNITKINPPQANESHSFVTLSEEGKRLSTQSEIERNLLNRASDSQESIRTRSSQNTPLVYQDKIQNLITPHTIKSQAFTDDEQKEIDQLKKRDLEVKNHERAHSSIGGRYAGAPHYQYETGPNGTRYATDGEVTIDLTEINKDPQATIDKMKQVYRAALAPREPSFTDRSIASQAQQSITTARTDLVRSKESSTDSSSANPIEQSGVTQTPQSIKNINAYKQVDNTSKNTLYQLA
jgi:hypothetical protein